MISIEKAILIDVCLGVPLGETVFPSFDDVDLQASVLIPDTFIFQGRQLAVLKCLYDQKDRRVTSALNDLIRVANDLLDGEVLTVTDKPYGPFSADLHEYQSMAKYWWPNPESTSGMPYTARDGDVNPECYDDKFDYCRIVSLSERVVILAFASYLTDDPVYGIRCSTLLDAWFINPTTRQKPSFHLSQRVPGQDKVRTSSMVEARFLIYVVEAVQLLHSTGSISQNIYEHLRVWFESLIDWMLSSEEGSRSTSSVNNIGFWADLQLMVYAKFCDRKELLDDVIEKRVKPRILKQIAEGGELPSELSRTRPYDYVAFTLAAMALISRVGENEGLKLWTQTTMDGKNFQVVHDWLLKVTEASRLVAVMPSSGRRGGEADLAIGAILDAGLMLRATKRALEFEVRGFKALESSFEEMRMEKVRLENDTSALKQILSASEDRVKLLENESDGLRKCLANTELTLKAQQAESFALQVRLSSSASENNQLRTALQQAVSQAQAAASASQRSYAERRLILKRARWLERRYNMLLSSTSWKMLAPLRSALSTIKALRTNHKSHTERSYTNLELSDMFQMSELESSSEPNDTAFVMTSHEREFPAAGATDQLSHAHLPEKEAPPKASGGANQLANIGEIPEPADRIESTLLAIEVKSKEGLSPSSPSTPDALSLLRSAKVKDEELLRLGYLDSELSNYADNFVIYRIIGNDLFPRHRKGQSRENLAFLLKNEPKLVGCEKRWIVNRIIDSEEEQEIIKLLRAHSQEYIHLPFEPEQYRSIGWDFDSLPAPDYLSTKEFSDLGPEQSDRVRTALYRKKNIYIMNNNGARNAALRDGRLRAKWVLPWDGNCFVTEKAWSDIRIAVLERPHLKYFVVPMERVTDNLTLLRDDFDPHPIEEPQIIFRCDASEEFNADLPYGRRPKVELFWRLGIPGPWDKWKDDPWDVKRGELSKDAQQFGVAGWVARMFSGASTLEQKDRVSFKNRGLARQEAIVSAIDYVDSSTGVATKCSGFAFYDPTSLDVLRTSADRTGKLGDLKAVITERAEAILNSPLHTVVQKTTLPPSGDIKDYWHPAPYWWPNPDKEDGLPYIRIDGKRVPGTNMYDESSDRYDRTRLQLMIDDTITSALAWYITRRPEFAKRGAELVRTWFVNVDTRMNPHLRYAQVRLGRNGNEGFGTGIIELKDLYYFLDGVKLLETSEFMTEEDAKAFAEWLKEYLYWLETSKQGRSEVVARNNHGTYFDLQTAAIAAFLGYKDKLRDIYLRAQSRLFSQFSLDGEQPEEMTRTITQHYVFFNLQGWLNLFRLMHANGLDVSSWSAAPQSRLRLGVDWVLKHDLSQWPFEQTEPFEMERLAPIVASARALGLLQKDEVDNLVLENSFALSGKHVFDPHDAVNPYWLSGLLSDFHEGDV